MKDKLLGFIRSGPPMTRGSRAQPLACSSRGQAVVFGREGRVLSYKESFLLGAEPCKVGLRKNPQRYDSKEYQGDCRLAH